MKRPIYLLLMALLALCAQAMAQTPEAEGPPGIEVEVVGIEDELRDNVLAFLGIEQRKDSDRLSASQIRRLHRDAPEEIRTALEPFGYYRPSIESELLRQEPGWRARYEIDPGPPIQVTELDLRVTGAGAEDPQFAEFIRDFPMEQGEALLHARYEEGKNALQRLASERGYLDAELTENEIRVNLDAYTAAAVLHFDTGSRYSFGAVSFEQEGFREAFLRRFLRVEPGDPYTTAALLDIQNVYSDSDYFERVEVEALRDQAADRRIPVRVRLEPRAPNQYTFGIGYGTDTGVRGTLGWERRRINARGHRFNALLEASQIYTRLTSRYSIPLADPRTDELAFYAGVEQEDTETSDSDKALVGASRTGLRFGWRETLYLNYQVEDFEVGDQEDTSNLLIPGGTWTRIRADDRIYTNRGSRIQLDLRAAAEDVLSDTSFVQAHAQGKFIRPLGERGRLLLRGDIGYTEVSELRELPPSIRFFAGGDQSVRGYDFNTLGPTNASGDVIGGKHLLVGSVEYEHRLTESWGAAVFYDVGNALNSFSDSLREGAGVGVRWRSPVGLVRVDLAVPLDESDDDLRLHLTIGPDL